MIKLQPFIRDSDESFQEDLLAEIAKRKGGNLRIQGLI